MISQEEQVHQLVSQVAYNRGYNGLDGLNPVRNILYKDEDGSIAACLEREMDTAEPKVRGGLAFILSAWYFENQNMHAVRKLCRPEDAEIYASALGALTGEPAFPILGAEVVELAIAGANHKHYEVRAAACSTLMNQAAWGVDVAPALSVLLECVKDSDAIVRQGAAAALGNIARNRRYVLNPHIDALTPNLLDDNVHVRTVTGWALWKLAGSRDITPAVPVLVKALESTIDYDGPRKQAAGALLSFARKSPRNREMVQGLVHAAKLDEARKEVARFQQQLSALP